jgi:U3 small nucleolar RNA-associated protein 19
MLIQQHNLDYPEFFVKLYALFTPTLFHTRYLARFLRLTDSFLSSTHLPATLVASFIKRLSRLSLTAPPHGVVAIIPMTYNLLKRHPICMQMIHRPDVLPGRGDPFDADERDPLKTGALESSLWELAVRPPHPPVRFTLPPTHPHAFFI